MKKFRTKNKRFLIKILNKIIKSDKISNNIILILSILCIFILLDISTNYFIYNMVFPILMLVYLFIMFLYTLIYKQKNKDKKYIKRKNFINFITIIFIGCCVSYYVLGVNDGGNITNIKGKNIISTDNIENLKGIENYLIQEKQIFIRENSNNSSTYTIKILNQSYRNRALLIVKMAESGLLNSSIHIDLFSNKADFNVLSRKIRLFLHCYVDGIKHVYIERTENSNLTKIIVDIDLLESADTDKIKQIVTSILLSTISDLTKENIIIINTNLLYSSKK